MRKMVLVSLDAMFDKDWAYYDGRFLGGFLQKCARCTKVKTAFPALTYPAHCTMVTGCTPRLHGVGQNQPYQPGKQPDMRRWYWEDKDIQRETLFQAVKRQGGKCAAMLWPVTGKSAAIKWNFPEVIALPGENQVLKMLRYGTAPWIICMELKHGRERVSIHEPHLSDYAVTLACDVISAHQPDLTAVHLVDVDEMRHHHGVDSAEARAGMDRMEARVEKIWQTMQETPGMEDALLVLVSDHGQADVDTTVELEAALGAAGMAVGVQSNGMTAYLFTKEPVQVQKWLEIHGGELGVCRVYDRDMLNSMGCIDGPSLAVEAALGVVFADGLPQAKREKATHGFGPDHPAENCLLAVRGRGIPPVDLPAMPMENVAPTLADLMGIDLPQAVGKSCAKDIKMSKSGDDAQKCTKILKKNGFNTPKM